MKLLKRIKRAFTLQPIPPAPPTEAEIEERRRKWVKEFTNKQMQKQDSDYPSWVWRIK